jgi:ABC-2 type transport system permease protein
MSAVVETALPPPSQTGLLRRELRLLLRSRLMLAVLILFAALSTLACVIGARAVDFQQERIEAAQAAQAESAALVSERYGPGKDAGNIAYHRFVLAWDAPATLGFAATGQRDIAPWLLRVRALGLEAQLYEGEHVSPELALAGHFDFAIVLVYLAPLVMIALLHDLVSGEREAGRLRLLLALPMPSQRLWLRRAGLRYAAALLALWLPAAVTALVVDASLISTAALLLVCALYLGFWALLSLWVSAGRGGSGHHAARLFGLWLLLCLVLPSLGLALLQRALPVDAGMDLMLAQRDEVHAGWDRPKSETFERFFADHPEWRDTPPVETRFHWKWYYALQHAGDMRVREASERYRARLLQRELWSARLGWLLPGVAAQSALHRIADSDLQAHLEFLERVRGLHAALRQHLYPYVFEERPWAADANAGAPTYADADTDSLPFERVLMLMLATLLIAAGAARALRRIEA